MANWYGAARSNYVLIEALEGLKASLERWQIESVTQASESDGLYALLAEDLGGWPSYREDENGEELSFSFEADVMPFVQIGEALIVMETGAEKLRYVTGWAGAYIRTADEIKQVFLNLENIYGLAAKAFGVPKADITIATY